MDEDISLLRAYAETGAEDAFRRLVGRKIGLVYHVALRRVGGDHQLAEEVAVRVCADLAKKAAALSQRTSLTGWLYVSARYAAADVARRESRQRALRVAVAMNAAGDNDSLVDREELRPVLEDALDRLREADRTALLLRFYEGRSLAQIGEGLDLTENAARMRVERALEKLRIVLGRSGIASTASALAAALPLHAATSVPSGMAAAAASGALAAKTSGASLLLGFMGITKAQTAMTLLLLAAVGAGMATVAVEDRQTEALATRAASLETRTADLPQLRGQYTSLQHEASALASAAATTASATTPTVGTEVQSLESANRIKGPVVTLRDLAREQASNEPKPTRAPVAIDQTRPQFPKDAAGNRMVGNVLVEFVVTVDGDVVSAKATKASSPELAQAAVDAVSQWIFLPGLRGGRSVNTYMAVPIVFTAK